MRFCSRVLHVKGHACKHQCRVLKGQASLGQRLVPFCRVKGRPQRTHVVFRKVINKVIPCIWLNRSAMRVCQIGPCGNKKPLEKGALMVRGVDQKRWRMPKAMPVESVPAEAVTPPKYPLPPGATWALALLSKRTITALTSVRLDNA